MTSRKSQIQEDTTFRVLRILEQQPDISQRALADRLALISLDGLHCRPKAFVDNRFLKIGKFNNSRHKFGDPHILAPAGLVEKAVPAGRVLKRKMAEYQASKAEIAAVGLGVKSRGTHARDEVQ